MIVLSTYLRLKGLVSVEEVIDRCGENAIEELDELIENKFVSVHTEPMGGKKYRFPYYSSWKIGGEKKSDVKVDSILGIIEENPGVNATTIKKKLGIAQKTFEKREQELLAEGKITRLKKGVSWTYYLDELPVPEKPEKPECCWVMFEEILEGRWVSVQHWAKLQGESRDAVTKDRNSLIAAGLVNEDGTVNYPDEGREELLDLHFKDLHPKAKKRLMEWGGCHHKSSTEKAVVFSDADKLINLKKDSFKPDDLQTEILKLLDLNPDGLVKDDIILQLTSTNKDVGPRLRRLIDQGLIKKDEDFYLMA